MTTSEKLQGVKAILTTIDGNIPFESNISLELDGQELRLVLRHKDIYGGIVIDLNNPDDQIADFVTRFSDEIRLERGEI